MATSKKSSRTKSSSSSRPSTSRKSKTKQDWPNLTRPLFRDLDSTLQPRPVFAGKFKPDPYRSYVNENYYNDENAAPKSPPPETPSSQNPEQPQRNQQNAPPQSGPPAPNRPRLVDYSPSPSVGSVAVAGAVAGAGAGPSRPPVNRRLDMNAAFNAGSEVSGPSGSSDVTYRVTKSQLDRVYAGLVNIIDNSGDNVEWWNIDDKNELIRRLNASKLLWAGYGYDHTNLDKLLDMFDNNEGEWKRVAMHIFGKQGNQQDEWDEQYAARFFYLLRNKPPVESGGLNDVRGKSGDSKTAKIRKAFGYLFNIYLTNFFDKVQGGKNFEIDYHVAKSSLKRIMGHVDLLQRRVYTQRMVGELRNRLEK